MIDTNAYSAFKLAVPAIVDIIQHAEKIAITPIVLGELMSGFDAGNKSLKNREELRQFLSSSRIRFYPMSMDTPNFYSKIYVSLKKKGMPIPTNDLWIAAQAMEHGCAVCTYDKHFMAIDGLVVGTNYAELAM